MDAELAGMLAYIFGTLAIGFFIVGGIALVRRELRLKREREEAARQALAEVSRMRLPRQNPPAPRIFPAPPIVYPHHTGRAATPVKANPTPAPAPAASGVDPLVAGIIGYELGSMSHHNDSAPDPTPAFEPGGGEYGGGGASASWDSDSSSSSDSGSDSSSDSGGFGGC